MHRHHGPTRRGVLQGLLGAAVASPAFAQAPPAELVARAGRTLTFAGSGGGLGEIQKGLIAEFTSQTGIQVNYLAGPLLDLYGRIRAERNRPSIDVYTASAVSEARGLQDGFYERLDPSIVTNLSEAYDLARIPEDRGVRNGFTDLGVLYNRRKVAEAGVTLRNWDDIWSPALRGRIILGDTTSFYTVLYIALMTQRLGGNVADPQQGIRYIADRRSHLLAVVRTYPERIQLLTNGEAWLTVDVGFTSLPETRNHADMAFLSPQDGTALFWNTLHAIRGAPNPIGAQLLINHLIGRTIQARWARESMIGPMNRHVELPADLAALVPHGQERIARLIALDTAAIGNNIGKYRDLWNAAMG